MKNEAPRAISLRGFLLACSLGGIPTAFIRGLKAAVLKRRDKLIVPVFALIFFTFFSQPVIAEDNKTVTEPAPAPDFQLQDIYQDIITLSDYKDKKPVILFFWATWCPFCQKELSVLNDLYPTLAEEGIELLSINVGELPDVVSAYVASYNLAYEVLLDKDASVQRAYQIDVPKYVLIDKEGRIVYKDDYFPHNEYKNLLIKERG